MKVLKRSSRYLGGCFAFLVLVGYGCENTLRKNLFGSDSKNLFNFQIKEEIT